MLCRQLTFHAQISCERHPKYKDHKRFYISYIYILQTLISKISNMQTYFYCLCLLTFSILSINARFVFRSTDDGINGDKYHPNSYLNHAHHLDSSQKLLHDLLNLELHGGRPDLNELPSFDRSRKEIERGDPREFMG
ncbi:hypothetical protein I4U23_012482 [Adineta vaga]|nr:hypothetical protein I4U23_012482 [Adineta vaga]